MHSPSSSLSPNGRSKNSGFDHALHSLALIGYLTFLFCSSSNAPSSSSAFATTLPISTPSSRLSNKPSRTVPSLVSPLYGSSYSFAHACVRLKSHGGCCFSLNDCTYS